jgi:hypothetical protein
MPAPMRCASTRGRRLALAAKIGAVAFCLGCNLHIELEGRARHAMQTAPSPLDGRWSVSPAGPWSRVLIFGWRGKRHAAVRDADDAVTTYALEGDLASGRLAFVGPDGGRLQLAVARDADGVLRLDGELPGGAKTLLLRAMPPREYPLMTRGFHWVNETAYNR